MLTMPLLVGLDGVQKMSKSLGNYVGIAEAPAEQFGKLMSLPDELMAQYFELATGWPLERERTRAPRARATSSSRRGEAVARPPVVDLYHGDGTGAAAEAEFDRVFVAHEVPDDVPEVEIPPGDVRDGRIRVATLVARAFPQRSRRTRRGAARSCRAA